MNSYQKKQNIKILMYHRVIKSGEQNNATFYDVREEDFRQQLQILDSFNFTPITFEDYNLYLDGKLTLPKKPIILTFDDGHTDMKETALPVLREFGMKAVVFVLGNRKMKYAEWDQKKKNGKTRLMSDDQILDIRAEGFEIGAHSMTHPTLPNLTTDELKGEVLGAKYAIEDLLGEEVSSFAYPFGRVNKKVQSTVAESGYKFGCGVYTGPPRFGDNDYDIRRLAITYNINTVRFLLRLLTPYQYVEWMYGKLRNNRQPSGAELMDKQASMRDYDITITNNF
ncbi:MAG: polysaccharide deacetylase family protein [Balneolaceae bacterium]